MSFVNPNWYLALAFCLIFFIGGRQLAETMGDRRPKGTMILILSVFALPSLLFPLAYLSGALNRAAWYNAFRAVNRIELVTSTIAPFAGFMTYRPPRAYRDASRFFLLRAVKPLAFPLSVLYLSLSFVRPLIRPIDPAAQLDAGDENWAGGVMMQSVLSGSGPASLASAMRSLGGLEGRAADSEYDIVRGTYTDGVGSEFWYLARWAVEKGCRYRFFNTADVFELPVPAVLRVVADGAERYVALLDNDGGRLTIGDPLRGRATLDGEAFQARYRHTGIALAIAPRGGADDPRTET